MATEYTTSQHFAQEQADVIDYTIDWSKWIGSHIIEATTWTAESGATIPANDFTNTTARGFVSMAGATPGNDYKISCQIETEEINVGGTPIRIKKTHNLFIRCI